MPHHMFDPPLIEEVPQQRKSIGSNPGLMQDQHHHHLRKPRDKPHQHHLHHEPHQHRHKHHTTHHHNGQPSDFHHQQEVAMESSVDREIMSHGILVEEDDFKPPYSRKDSGGGHSRMTSLSGPGGTRGGDSRSMRKDHIEALLKEGYSSGLARALSENAAVYDFRFWVVDNSGSMQIGDGHRILKAGKKGALKAVASTRWEEIQETVNYHSRMASILDSPTIFKLLNDPGLRTGPQQFSVGENGESAVPLEVENAISIMKKVKPGGVTPLTNHIWDIQESITSMAPELRRKGKKVAVILATDGLPTDEQGYGGQDITDEFVRALRALEGLPVWVVVRLCTDEESVTHFYNSLDSQLELSMEVLDDYMGEAREVYAKNPWICYGISLHRCRELGYHDRLFDLIDERPLTKGEARSFCCLILGIENEEEIPDPAVNFSAFLKAVNMRLSLEQLQWNPVKKKLTPWILTKAMAKSFSERACVIL